MHNKFYVSLLISLLLILSFNPIPNPTEPLSPPLSEMSVLPSETQEVLEETTIKVEIPMEIVETMTEVVETTTKPQEKPTVKQKKTKQGFGVFKSYTDYRCLSRKSAQWKLQMEAYTDENGLRKIGDAYLVALGSYYGTQLGTRYTVTLSNGNVFDIILCDCKQNRHTDKTNRECLNNGSVLEFYVETEKMPKKVQKSGTISSIEFFSGSVEEIEKTA